MPSNLSCINNNEVGFLNKFPTLADMERAYAPSYWGYAIRNSERAYTARSPTLNSIDSIYGEGSATHWIQVQFTGLFLMSSSDKTEIVDSIPSFSEIFAQEVGKYTISELLLFFARYSIGHYGASNWSSFDLRRTTSTFFNEFLPERKREKEQIEDRNAEELKRTEHESTRKNAITYEQYLALKGKSLNNNKQIQ